MSFKVKIADFINFLVNLFNIFDDEHRRKKGFFKFITVLNLPQAK